MQKYVDIFNKGNFNHHIEINNELSILYDHKGEAILKTDKKVKENIDMSKKQFINVLKNFVELHKICCNNKELTVKQIYVISKKLGDQFEDALGELLIVAKLDGKQKLL